MMNETVIATIRGLTEVLESALILLIILRLRALSNDIRQPKSSARANEEATASGVREDERTRRITRATC